MPSAKVLQRVDGDKVSSMGFLFGDLEAIKEEIKAPLANKGENNIFQYERLTKDRMISFKRFLHRVRYFLNP